MGGDVTEDQEISRAQYLDLVYSQFGTLYDLIPQAPCPSTDPAKPPAETHADRVIGSIQPPSVVKAAKQPSPSTIAPSNPTVSAKVNSIQSMQSSSSKKKGKGKNKKPGNQQENPKPTARKNDNKGKRKYKYPFLLCGGDNFMKECPQCDEINKFLKSNAASAVVTDPFPSQQQLVDHMSNQRNSSST